MPVGVFFLVGGRGMSRGQIRVVNCNTLIQSHVVSVNLVANLEGTKFYLLTNLFLIEKSIMEVGVDF